MTKTAVRHPRMACCVPGCGRTTKADEAIGTAWICGIHWRLTDRRLRQRRARLRRLFKKGLHGVDNDRCVLMWRVIWNALFAAGHRARSGRVTPVGPSRAGRIVAPDEISFYEPEEPRSTPGWEIFEEVSIRHGNVPQRPVIGESRLAAPAGRRQGHTIEGGRGLPGDPRNGRQGRDLSSRQETSVT